MWKNRMESPRRLRNYTGAALMLILLLQSRKTESWGALAEEDEIAMSTFFNPKETDKDNYDRTLAAAVSLYNYNKNNKRTASELDYSAEDPENRYVVPSSAGLDVMRKRTLSLFSRLKTLDQLRRNMALPFYSRYQRKPILAQRTEQVPKAPRDATLANPVPRGYYRSLRPLGQPLRWG